MSNDKLSVERMAALQDRAMGKPGIDPITPVEVQQLIGEVLFCHAKIAAMEPKIVALEAANVEWAKRFNEQPPAPAAPGTDAELHREFVGGMAAMAEMLRDRGVINHEQWEATVYWSNNVDHAHKAAGRQQWNNLHAACARMRRGVAAAEELARAVDEAVSVVEYHAGLAGEPPTERVRLSRDRFDALRTALAAFRAAQGGGPCPA